jgi:hypothetical protein
MKTFTLIAFAAAGLLAAAPLAHAQEGETTGTVSGEASASVGTETPANASVAVSSSDAPGKLGFGATLILSGVGGVEAQYHVSDKLMVGGLILLDNFSPDMGDSTTTFGIAASGFLNLIDKSWADLYGGVRLGFLSGSFSAGGFSADATTIMIELPLRIEIPLHRRFALHFETGIALDFLTISPGAGAPDQSATFFTLGARGASPLGLSAGGGGDIFATGGFTIYL